MAWVRTGRQDGAPCAVAAQLLAAVLAACCCCRRHILACVSLQKQPGTAQSCSLCHCPSGAPVLQAPRHSAAIHHFRPDAAQPHPPRPVPAKHRRQSGCQGALLFLAAPLPVLSPRPQNPAHFICQHGVHHAAHGSLTCAGPHQIVPALPSQLLQKPSTFFDDEWRTPTYVGDLVAACCAAVERCGQLPPSAGERIINVGGPQRINRVDMALALCRVSCCVAVCCAAACESIINMLWAVTKGRYGSCKREGRRRLTGWTWPWGVQSELLYRMSQCVRRSLPMSYGSCPPPAMPLSTRRFAARPAAGAAGRQGAIAASSGPLLCVLVGHASTPLQVRGYDPQLVQPGSAASVPRTCATPADISMDTSRLQVGCAGCLGLSVSLAGLEHGGSNGCPWNLVAWLHAGCLHAGRRLRKACAWQCCSARPRASIVHCCSGSSELFIEHQTYLLLCCCLLSARPVQAVLGVRPTPFVEALRLIFQATK